MPDEHRRRVLCQHRRRKSDDRRYGFWLLGHLKRNVSGAGVQARVDYDAIPKLPGVEEYIKLGAVPGGTERNFASYGHLMGEMPREVRDLLCDPQTSGGLLLAVMPEAENEVKATAAEFGIELTRLANWCQRAAVVPWLRSVNSMRLFIAEKPESGARHC
ncbi:selenophosphate synthetase [Escherichia coli]|uniref:Selenophosphate synthetase n=1 Tax=Escherichia coli TaxID=562 RepID=A0A377BA23_ECOLX|nr:selenophosphate synthetase [Escherichia coli]